MGLSFYDVIKFCMNLQLFHDSPNNILVVKEKNVRMIISQRMGGKVKILKTGKACEIKVYS